MIFFMARGVEERGSAVVTVQVAGHACFVVCSPETGSVCAESENVGGGGTDT